MTETQRLQEDLQFVRHAVVKRDSPAPTPGAILILWGVYVLVGYTLLDFNRTYASMFLAIAGITGGVASLFIGRWYAQREGQVNEDEGVRHALHWGSILIAIAAIMALAYTRRDQISGNGEIVGQLIAMVIGIIYFLAGVHFDRYFLGLGLLLVVGSIAISFMPRYGWTSLGVLISAGLMLPVLLRNLKEKTVSPTNTEETAQ